jgi:hypothetical protein
MKCHYCEISVFENKGITELFDLVIDRCMILHEKIKEEQEKDGTAAANNKNPNMKDVSFKLGQFNPGEKYDGIKP